MLAALSGGDAPSQATLLHPCTNAVATEIAALCLEKSHLQEDAADLVLPHAMALPKLGHRNPVAETYRLKFARRSVQGLRRVEHRLTPQLTTPCSALAVFRFSSNICR